MRAAAAAALSWASLPGCGRLGWTGVGVPAPQPRPPHAPPPTRLMPVLPFTARLAALGPPARGLFGCLRAAPGQAPAHGRHIGHGPGPMTAGCAVWLSHVSAWTGQAGTAGFRAAGPAPTTHSLLHASPPACLRLGLILGAGDSLSSGARRAHNTDTAAANEEGRVARRADCRSPCAAQRVSDFRCSLARRRLGVGAFWRFTTPLPRAEAEIRAGGLRRPHHATGGRGRGAAAQRIRRRPPAGSHAPRAPAREDARGRGAARRRAQTLGMWALVSPRL
ncbi:MAG: hypothetical protein J3K34DRAFT_12998 [Monoraphidium minutum]|nr:MAG: hypothetical protein J3K34DRAFT_12998 [Monoraphidium minutum]